DSTQDGCALLFADLGQGPNKVTLSALRLATTAKKSNFIQGDIDSLVVTTREGEWRDLEIRVTPKDVTACLGEKHLDSARLKVLSTYIHLRGEENPAPEKLPAVFSPRQGLGLFVIQGAADFREVVLGPLP